MSLKTQTFKIFSIPLSVFFLLLLVSDPSLILARPSYEDVSNIANTLRYLESLEKYYSQIARPRFGRSLYKSFNAENHVDPKTFEMILDQPDDSRR
ncbi:neuropeptide F-like [Limulus polyphemus]|uniref:Neuropeptide F-like n=1 Tax=Limulus polyphemus TaxID=6850 RepID=A0ABM1S4H4_LIMPO|nr:neuropeptide F-like [Limulus polyphemus]